MTNRSKQKGTAWETALVAWLREHGFPYAERRTLAGKHDKGDVSGIPGVVLEAKNCVTWTPSEWIGELQTEMANAGVDVGAVVIRRRGTTDAGRAYALLPLEVFVRLLEDDPR